MSTLFAIPLAVNSAHAIPGNDVLAAGNTWSPYGPYAVSGGATNLRHLILKYYTGDAAEYAAFQAGGPNGLDVADDGTSGNGPPAAQWPVYDNTCGACTPTSNGIDWIMTPAQGSANWQGMYFNGASSTWANWNCNWNFYNSLCGQEMRQAFSHLINRPDFVAANDQASSGLPLWDDAPANKVLSTCFTTAGSCDGTPPAGACPTLTSGIGPACTFQSPSANFCTWDTVSNVGCAAANGPYLVGGTGVGVGFPGIPAGPVAGCPSGNIARAAWAGCNSDFALAAEHMVLAGVATGMDANYQIGAHLTNAAGIAAHHLRACVRSTEPRRTMGLGWTNSLKLLMGSGGNPNTNAVDVQLGNIIVCGFNKAFSEPPTSPIDDWDMYTYGFAAGGPYPDFLYTQYATKFTFIPGGCGGAAAFTADFPTNPTFTCIDGRGALGNADAALLTAVAGTASETAFDHKMVLDVGSALDILGRAVEAIPVHTTIVRVPALRSVDGIVNTKGLGFANVLTFLLAHKGSYAPVNSQFRYNDNGSPDTIRWGEAQPVEFLNPFQAGSVWEFNSIGLVYDTLFTANPVRPNEVYCEMCQTVAQQAAVCGAQACTQFTVTLRQNLYFQDGTQVTARDVAFSLLNLRDFSSVLSGGLALLDHISLDPQPLKLSIFMLGSFVGHLVNLSGITILPMNGNSPGGIPRWACPSSGISIDGSTPCNTAFYTTAKDLAGSPAGTTIPQADQFKAGPGYDPITDNNLIGSGLMACISDGGIVGTGCAKDSNGNPTGQEIDPGGSLRLTAYDLTATLGSNAQFTRLNNPDWSVGGSRSGQQQEWYYSDWKQNNKVTAADKNSANLCFGASAPGGNCPAADYTHWLRNSLHTGTPGTISTETAIVVSHYEDGGILPYSWSAPGGDAGLQGTITNVVPYSNPYP